ncbi:MAG TPA: methyltransferase domain-containing protein [Solirubrobacterales bacterium]|nr:methyltransferase domain-containing protein [Solirubrobacterales bacterium]
MTATRDWDAATYDRVSTPQQQWARAVVDRLGLRGDEVVLDAGCGTGRVTAMLLERLPRGRVLAVDGSAAMIAEARTRLDPARTELIEADLLRVALPEPVDAVFSNAVFHWIPDHRRLFANLGAALVPGGRLVAQCGGRGNVARFYAALDQVIAGGGFTELDGFDPVHFPVPEETQATLAATGFEAVRCWLEPSPVRPPEPREFVRSVCLGAHLELLEPGRRDELVDAVTEALGPDPVLDYVRLNVSARRSAAPAPS